VFPLIFGFFVSVAPEGVSVMTDIAKYLDFVLKLFFAFGVAFEVPVATVLLVISGITTPDALAEKRPYMVVGVFVLAMLLTPPDVISQTLLAVPVLLLFEIGILAARFVTRDRVDEHTDPDSDPDPTPPGGNKPQPGTAQPGVSHPGAAEAAATGMAALNAPLDLDDGTVGDRPATQSEEQHQADSDAGLHDYPGQDDEDDWEQGDDELDSAIAEQDALDAATDEAETDPPTDWDDDPGRFTEDGLDQELELMDGDPDDVPPPTAAVVDTTSPDHGAKQLVQPLAILVEDTRPDPGKPGLTIPRSFGVWRLPTGSEGKQYRFGNYPIRGKELAREFGEATLVTLYSARLAAKADADRLNQTGSDQS